MRHLIPLVIVLVGREVDERGFTRANEPQHRVEYRSYDLQRDLKQ
jgi:hypothetical protein